MKSSIKTDEVKCALLQVSGGSSYNYEWDDLVARSITDWETISLKEYQLLKQYVSSRRDLILICCKDIHPLTIADAVKWAQEQEQKELEREKRKEVTNKKRKQAAEKRRKEKDLKKLEELKKKYEASLHE